MIYGDVMDGCLSSVLYKWSIFLWQTCTLMRWVKEHHIHVKLLPFDHVCCRGVELLDRVRTCTKQHHLVSQGCNENFTHHLKTTASTVTYHNGTTHFGGAIPPPHNLLQLDLRTRVIPCGDWWCFLAHTRCGRIQARYLQSCELSTFPLGTRLGLDGLGLWKVKGH